MRDRFKKILTLTLSLALSASIMTPVFALESDASQTSPVTLTAQPIVFNVGVPTGLPVSVDAQGNVTVATDAKITNNSAAPIMIAGVQVKPITDWNIVAMNKDFKSSKIGTKEFGFVLNNDEVPASGVMTLTPSNWPSVNGNSSLPLSYDSVVAPQKDAIEGSKIADVVFTIGWDSIVEEVIDITPPVVSWSAETLEYGTPWYGDLIVNAEASDDSGEVVSIYLKAAGKNFENGVEIKEPGIYSFTAYAVDKAGNVGKSTALVLRVEPAINDFVNKVALLNESSTKEEIMAVKSWFDALDVINMRIYPSGCTEAINSWNKLNELVKLVG